jgi:hypothetical protein
VGEPLNEINFKFSWYEIISEYDNNPVWGNYNRETRTVTVFLGTFGKCLKQIYQQQSGLLLDFSIKGWFEEFEKTIQEECLHASIEDVRGRVEREREEWVIDKIEEALK